MQVSKERVCQQHVHSESMPTSNSKNSNMRKLLLYMGMATALLQVGCTKDFDEINTDPTQTNEDKFNANYLLSNSQITYAGAFSGYNGGVLFQSGWVQIIA